MSMEDRFQPDRCDCFERGIAHVRLLFQEESSRSGNHCSVVGTKLKSEWSADADVFCRGRGFHRSLQHLICRYTPDNVNFSYLFHLFDCTHELSTEVCTDRMLITCGERSAHIVRQGRRRWIPEISEEIPE